MNIVQIPPRLKSRLRISLTMLQLIVLALFACIYFSHGRLANLVGFGSTMMILVCFTVLLFLSSFLAAVLFRWWLPALVGLIISAISFLLMLFCLTPQC